ncbi:MAG: histidine--tRNA ligase, partial [Candidatus Sungbacteria bacterium]|nr:histidine--tRNA ligase [Candidatus Sungbacteria bacterium]
MAKAREKSKTFQSPRGTHDILPEEQRLWDKVRESIRVLSNFYGFERIDTPHFEDTDLFYVGTGRTTDIVTKQMYSFKTRGGDQLTLRPEGTPPIARAYVEHGMANLPQPVKLYYIGSFFRHESPQRGRFREFRQWGLELIGDEGAVADAQVIQVYSLFLQEWGIKDAVVEINSVGCQACRPSYRAQLTQYYRSRVRGLCRDCKERFRDNPLRLLDCGEEKCVTVKKNAPQLLDRLCEPCRNHFKLVLEFLDEMKIPYALNPHLVRGLDYYTRTVFETFVEGPSEASKTSPASSGDGAPPPQAAEDPPAKLPPKKLAVVSGGRYDDLVALIGGKPTPAVGAAMGLERLLMVIKERRARLPETPKPKVFLVQLGDLAKKKSFRIMEE